MLSFHAKLTNATRHSVLDEWPVIDCLGLEILLDANSMISREHFFIWSQTNGTATTLLTSMAQRLTALWASTRTVAVSPKS